MSFALPEFTYVGFQPTEELKTQAHCRLDDLLEKAPYGSIAVALLERNDAGYRCSIEIYSPRGPFIANSHHSTGEGALEAVYRILAPKIHRWREKQERARSSEKRVLKPIVC